MAAQPLQAATICKKPFPLVTVRKIANCNYNSSFTNILSGFPEALILCPYATDVLVKIAVEKRKKIHHVDRFSPDRDHCGVFCADNHRHRGEHSGLCRYN